MTGPVRDQDDPVPPSDRDGEVSVAVWALAGIGLMLAFILALIVLSPAP